MLTFKYWVRNLFTDADGEFSEARWAVLSVVAGVLAAAGLALACWNLPATSRQGITVIVNDPGNAPVTVVVQQP